MAQYLSNEIAGDATGLTTASPVGYRPAANVVGARVKAFRATITYASQASGSTIVLGKIPAGAAFAYGVITVGTSAGSSTIAIGNSSSSAKHKAAATHTTTDTPAVFGKAAAIAGAANTDDETIIATIGAADLPSSGTAVIEIFFTSAN
jgi:hypothetical protein